MTALRQAERLASHRPGRRRAGHGVRQPGQRDDARAPLRAGARACRAERVASRSARVGPRPGGRARDPRTDLRAAGRSGARRRGAAPRARGAQPDSVPRDDRRGLRHAGADSPDSRAATTSPASSSAARATPTAPTDARPATGTSGRSASWARGWRCAGARSTKRSRAPTRSCSAGRAAVRRPAGHAHRRRSAHRRRTGRPRRTSGWRPSPTALDPRVAPATWGEYLRLRGALHAQKRRAADAYHDFAQSATLLDLLGERYQAALSHLALGRLVAQTGARSVAERHLDKAIAVFDAARRRARSRGHARRARAADQCRHPASTSSPRPTPTMRSCGGSWMRRRCRTCWGAKRRRRCSKRPRGDAAVVFVSCPAATCGRRRRGLRRRHGARRWRARAAHGQPTGAARCSGPARAGRRRSAIRARRLATPDRPSGDPAAADDCRRRPAGLRAVRGARPLGPHRRARPSIARSSRCCRDSCPRARRWRAWSSRSSGCRATT